MKPFLCPLCPPLHRVAVIPQGLLFPEEEMEGEREGGGNWEEEGKGKLGSR